jgi:hypothetical protein
MRRLGIAIALALCTHAARADECASPDAAARRDALVPERPALASELGVGAYEVPRVGDATAMRAAIDVGALHPLWLGGAARYVSLSNAHAFGAEGLAGLTLRSIRARGPCDRDRFDLRLVGGVRVLSFAASDERPKGMSAAAFGFGFAAATTDLGEIDGRATILYDPTHDEVGYMVTGGYTAPLLAPFGRKWLRIGLEQGLIPAVGWAGGVDIGIRVEL